MDIEAIVKENQELKVLVAELQEKLKRYTNPNRNKKYYENNKEYSLTSILLFKC
jgi:hypothetical protein